MSWAARRKLAYISGVVLFFAIILGAPALYWIYSSTPPACPAGTKRPPGETNGPCPILDEAMLQPESTLWARSFRVRDGTYNAVAYVENPNEQAGMRGVRYRLGLYDEKNVLVAERFGTAFLMPGGITPIFEGGIDTGNRIVAHTYINFDPASFTWERMEDRTKAIVVTTSVPTDLGTMPRLTATVKNTDVADMQDVAFIAVVFDPAGNAFAASQTLVPRLAAGATSAIVFTWPDPFAIQVGRIDVLPVSAPIVLPVPAL